MLPQIFTIERKSSMNYISYSLGFLLISVCTLSAMEQKQNHFAKLHQDIVIGIFNNLDLDTKNIPLVCKQFYKTRKVIFDKIKIDGFEKDAYKIECFKKRLITFEKQGVISRELEDYIYYADSELSTSINFKKYQKTSSDFNETIKEFYYDMCQPCCHTLEDLEKESIHLRLNSSILGLITNKINEIKTTSEAENSQNFKGDKEIAHIYVAQVPRDRIITLLCTSNKLKLITYYNLITLFYLKRLILNKEKKSNEYIIANIESTIRFLDYKKYDCIYIDNSRKTSQEKGCRYSRYNSVIHLRDFNKKPTLLRHFLELLPCIITDKYNFTSFCCADKCNGSFCEEIDPACKKVVLTFVNQLAASREQKEASLSIIKYGESPGCLCLIS
jgi:hypothetical protein